MTIRTVLEGNSFYEIDEECMEQRLNERGTAGTAAGIGGRAVVEQGQRGFGAAAQNGQLRNKGSRDTV